jgi:hypothetical protein
MLSEQLLLHACRSTPTPERGSDRTHHLATRFTDPKAGLLAAFA